MDSQQASEIEKQLEYIVFVYGSLKQGFSGHEHLEGAPFIGKATTVDKYMLTSNRYPLLSKSQQLCYVKGECYSISKKILDRLDEYEEVPQYYTRDVIQVTMDSTKELKDVFAYFCEIELGQTIHHDGDYIEEKVIVV